MSFDRKMRRAKIKNAVGSNHIERIWQRQQIKHYGFKQWWDMRVNCDPAKRRAITIDHLSKVR
mgnify:CR=1 FL=1